MVSVLKLRKPCYSSFVFFVNMNFESNMNVQTSLFQIHMNSCGTEEQWWRHSQQDRSLDFSIIAANFQISFSKSNNYLKHYYRCYPFSQRRQCKKNTYNTLKKKKKKKPKVWKTFSDSFLSWLLYKNTSG